VEAKISNLIRNERGAEILDHRTFHSRPFSQQLPRNLANSHHMRSKFDLNLQPSSFQTALFPHLEHLQLKIRATPRTPNPIKPQANLFSASFTREHAVWLACVRADRGPELSDGPIIIHFIALHQISCSLANQIAVLVAGETPRALMQCDGPRVDSGELRMRSKSRGRPAPWRSPNRVIAR
jgi:hypothetical protein